MSIKVELYTETGGYARLTVPRDEDLAGVIGAVRDRLGIKFDPELARAETERWNELQKRWKSNQKGKA